MGYHDCAVHGVGNTVIKEQEIGRQQSVTIRTAAFCSFLTKQKHFSKTLQTTQRYDKVTKSNNTKLKCKGENRNGKRKRDRKQADRIVKLSDSIMEQN